MDSLVDYIMKHTTRGECSCDRCLDRDSKPDPIVHVADVFFFKVTVTDSPEISEFLTLTKAHKGEFIDCDPLDGEEHNYMELGGWLGDQGLAMQYMGLGALLGLFNLMTPRNMLPGIPEEMMQQIAGQGMISIKKKKNQLKEDDAD